MKYIKLNHRIQVARWDEGAQEWLVKVQIGDDPEDVFEDWANVLVDASGGLKYVLSRSDFLPF